MKKITVFLILLMSISVLFLTSCDTNDEHTHQYSSWVVSNDPTCTTPGTKSKSCSCGDVITDPIPATGHNMVSGVCTECGKRE